MSKATAVAHPIQGLVKYHGLADPVLRLPFHDSISVCTAPLETRTTVAFGDFERDSLRIDGVEVAGRALERASAVVDRVRALAGMTEHFKAVSENNFPANVGLGSSASGFAALALASAAAAGLDLSPRELSTIARRGAGSASRSVTGAFSLWRRGISDADSYAEQLAGEELQMGMVVVLVPAYKETEDAHREVISSPFFDARLAEMPKAIAEMTLAIKKGDVGRIMMLAERDTLMLHGITMTGAGEMLLWRPDTLQVILAVRRMREDGLPAFFSIDTGATVYVNTFPEDVEEVERHMAKLGLETIRCHVGGPAELVDDHLF
jgi:phosphomevalonate decarboxylase